MDTAFCSQNFSAFCLAVCTDVRSVDDLLARMQEPLVPLAAELSVGRLELHFSAPPSSCEPNGCRLDAVILSAPDSSAPDCVTELSRLETGGAVTLSAYPVPGTAWDAAAREALHLLFSVTFTAFGLARTQGFLRMVQDSDALTGVLNTQGFQKRLMGVISAGQGDQYATVFSNIKNFKYINNRMGQACGDAILRSYSRMHAEFLAVDGLFCRLGGDNFMALVKKAVLDGYLRFSQLVRISVEHKGTVTVVPIATRQGIYELDAGSTMGDAMGNPSVAFQAAKASRSQSVLYFRPEMLKNTMHDKGISATFPEALANNEFLVYYQPKVTLKDNRLCGCEALTRWQHDRLISPSDFILVLENEGSIRNLDFYMLEGVCRDLRDWLDRGIEPVRVSTNFSKVHLTSEHFEQRIFDMLDKYRIPPQYLEIELTELSDYMFYDRLLAFVKAVHGHGIHVSIDDFGTGYSSMKLLKDLQADVIKLDKSLIDNIKLSVGGQNANADEIVSRAIINMAAELHIDVIAEGVETSYQAEFLRENGCSMAQGFLFDKPLPHDEFERLLTGSRVYGTPDG